VVNSVHTGWSDEFVKKHPNCSPNLTVYR
jgi:hypothetical protein